ncbi:MAG: hypothetical protein HYU53_08815 [Acidobacteria bacterium]|nr:hypothetical protein [Acidobacteriota bacterium]
MSAASSLRILRALAWLRWRVLINTITRSGARDIIERVSRTAESLLPIAIAVLLTPAAVGLAVFGVWTGWSLTGDPLQSAFPLQVMRWTLAVALLLTLMGPILLSTGAQAAGLIRLMLLPIPARTLYFAHTVSGLSDPWVFLSVPLLAGVAVGGAVRGTALPALAALAAGVAFLLLLLGIASLSSATLQLIVRDRRRAESLVLVGLVFVVVVSLLPSAFIPKDAGRRRGPRHRGEVGLAVPGWMQTTVAAIPSEIYVRAMREAAMGRGDATAARCAGLLIWAALAHGLTWPVYQRMLRTPASSGRARRIAGHGGFATVPLAGPRTSAVAVSFVRLALRTPRGRAIVLMPIVMLAVFTVLFVVRDNAIPIGPVNIGAGYSLGIFGIVLALLAIAPFAFNQFAVDGAGLTLEFLSPISPRELLYGKAAGGALIAAVPCALSLAVGAGTGAHSAVLWSAVIFGALAAYVVLSPVAAILSLLFPRGVDLSSVGNAGNAHQAAGLLGVLAFVVSCAPPAAIAAFALRALDSPAAAAALLAAWLPVATALAYAGFTLAERLMEARRENLLMVASGK